ncbi:hypothetical protein ABW20_dc0110419 [Dactylellina cionopaga]|nr:hypothetical protein ABW20_dc0110419 [Dactylellina cionopaga]
MLIMSLTTSGSEGGVDFGIGELLEMFGIKLPAVANILLDAGRVTLDTRNNSKNSIWFFPASSYATTLRLQFVPANDSFLKQLLDSINNMMKKLIPSFQVNILNPRLVLKKTWKRLIGPAPAVTSSFVVLIDIKLDEELTVEAAIDVNPGQVEWILTFNPDTGGLSLDKLIEFIIGLFPSDIKDIPLPKTLLPKDMPKNTLLRRFTFTSSEVNGSSILLDFQVTVASQIFMCHLSTSLSKVSFLLSGELATSSTAEEPADSETYSHLRFLPTAESWKTLDVSPVAGDVVSEVGNLNTTHKALSGANADLPEGPFELNLLGLNFVVSASTLSFGAVIVSPPPDPTKYKVPPIRLGTASLNLDYDRNEGKIQDLTVATDFELTAGPTQPGDNTDRARISLACSYRDSKWTLMGSAGGISGALLYKFFDDDCNLELIQILRHIVVNLDLRYDYESGQGSSFLISGRLLIGKLEFGLTYQHFGKDKAGNSAWDFSASLGVDSGSSSLLDVVQSLCDVDLSKVLPCLADVQLTPAPNEDKPKLSSLRVVKPQKFSNYLVIIFRLKLTDGLSLTFYQVQEKRANVNITTASKTKRLLVLSLTTLPTISDIPLIGSIPQPFDEISFAWVPGDEDFNHKELTVVNGCMDADDLRIRYKDTKGAKGVWNEEDVVLQAGFHFIAANAGKVLLDYAFGGSKEEESKALELSASATAAPSKAPINKTIGPLKISSIGFGFELGTQTLSVVMDASLKLGPLELAVTGFGLRFEIGKGGSLTDVKNWKLGFSLKGLGAGFDKPPIQLAGLFLRGDDGSFAGGASVGFEPWLFQAAGYYGSTDGPKGNYKTFFTYCRLNGPLMTIGYAEISGLTGGFGYNSDVAFPSVTGVTSFPFLEVPDTKTPMETMTELFKGTWFSKKQDSYWVAAGLSLIAFQMLKVSAVLVVQWERSVKIGIFGIATAEMPKKVPKPFVRVQLGLAATLDIDQGILKIEGQLTPASYILDPSCHLTGGFALYSWFGSKSELQGDWVFTVGGYHASYRAPVQYPRPPRLGISWSYDEAINITGEAYFAITPTCCMGGGSLKVTLSIGSLYAWFDAYADFLIKYKPFHFQAEGGVSVGLTYTLDLWLVTLHISLSIGARLYLEGPPIAGRVHVDFWVFGFDVNFGHTDKPEKQALEFDEFYHLVMQADAKPAGAVLPLLESGEDARVNGNDPLAPHIFSCQSGLIPSGEQSSSPNDQEWKVHGAIFTFSVNCKFAITEAWVETGTVGSDALEANIPVKAKPTDPTPDALYSRPMKMEHPFYFSKLIITIRPETYAITDQANPINPIWDTHEFTYSSLPTALWGKYDKNYDPDDSSSNLLNSNQKKTNTLITGVTVHPPKPRCSEDKISKYNVKEAMGLRADCEPQPTIEPGSDKWNPEPPAEKPWDAVADIWKESTDKAAQTINAWTSLMGADGGKKLESKPPEDLIKKIHSMYLYAPLMGAAA